MARTKPDITRDADTVRISGDLMFDTVEAVEGALVEACAAASRVDLAPLTRIDSAGVALILEAVLTARRAGRSLAVAAMPTRMAALVNVYGLNEFFTA